MQTTLDWSVCIMVKVYIDGQEGTTGLKIIERFENRDDIQLIKILKIQKISV